MKKEWPKNSTNIETSMIFALPEILGIIHQENVWVHIQLDTGKYIPINAKYCFSYPLSTINIEIPTIFYEDTKQIVEIQTIPESTLAYFGIIYECKDQTYSKGTFCITFSAWKEDNLTYYYTAQKTFSLESN